MQSSDAYENIHVTASTYEERLARAGETTSIDAPPKPESVPARENDASTPGSGKGTILQSVFWQKWYAAFKSILSIYIPVHLALLVISCLAFLFVIKDFSGNTLPVATLWNQWRHWDSNFYIEIATVGYRTPQHPAFFPLYPLLIRGVSFITHSPVIAGLLISNIAELFMFVVLYRLIEEDFDGKRAYYSVLYFAIFPTAFFFSAIYTESLFLCFSTLTFYQLRRGRWWWAALCAGLASFTRPDGMFLLVPFCYEYFYRLWQLQEQPPHALFSLKELGGMVKGIRPNILAALGFPAGIFLVMAYGYYRFHDLLAFVHAHRYWSRITSIPGASMLTTLRTIHHYGIFNFLSMRSSIELGADLFILVLIVLCFIGPWKLPKSMWGYGFYALAIYLYLQTFPVAGEYPLESMSRFVLEIFPAFILLSRIRTSRTVNLSYCMVAGALFFFLLTQFLSGHWIT